jgi:hypothetical protein
MAYTINRYSGTEFAVLEDATINDSTSIALVGRNYVGYGEIQNENFLWLLENFANTAAPARPISGQTWYDTTDNVLYSYNGTNWNVVGAAAVTETAPENPSPGSFWYRTTEKTMYMYTGTNWLQIGPEVADGFDETRAHSTTVLATDNRRYPIIKIIINGLTFGIFASDNFTINAAEPIAGFNTLKIGLNMSTDAKVTGDLEGLAARATILDTTRQINGVGFNGSSDITIKSSTTAPLIKGDYIVGSDFDGSNEVRWDIDASTANEIGKVVARDSAGDFSAGTITADLIGDVSGNVTTNTGTSTFDIIVANEVIGPVLSGNANTATKLRDIRTINGINFDGTEDITITAAANTLTTTTLAGNVVSSSLTQVGTLVNLAVADAGITVGTGNQLKVGVVGTTPTVTSTDTQNGLDIILQNGTSTSADYSFTISPASKTLSLGGDNVPAIIPKTNMSSTIGTPSRKFSKVHSNQFIGDLIGNADTATQSQFASNLNGGGPGSIPYQTAAGTTSFIPTIANKVLRTSGAGIPIWDDPAFADLTPGNYITGLIYDANTTTTWSVDASTSNVAGKVVARDGSGNFSAGTITANLNGTVNGVFSGTSYGQHIGNVVGNVSGTASLNVRKSGDTMSGYLTLHANPSQPMHAATKGYIDTLVGNIDPYWAGSTTAANVIATYVNYPINTRVSYWETRVFTQGSGNGGTYTFYDLYRRTLKKVSPSGWVDIGG